MNTKITEPITLKTQAICMTLGSTKTSSYQVMIVPQSEEDIRKYGVNGCPIIKIIVAGLRGWAEWSMSSLCEGDVDKYIVHGICIYDRFYCVNFQDVINEAITLLGWNDKVSRGAIAREAVRQKAIQVKLAAWLIEEVKSHVPQVKPKLDGRLGEWKRIYALRDSQDWEQLKDNEGGHFNKAIPEEIIWVSGKNTGLRCFAPKQLVEKYRAHKDSLGYAEQYFNQDSYRINTHPLLQI